MQARRGLRGRMIAVLAGATLVATTMGAGATYTSAFAPPGASLTVLGASCATDKRPRVLPGSRAAAPAPAGARAARMMASAGGKGGKQRNGAGKRRDDAGDDKPDADRYWSLSCLFVPHICVRCCSRAHRLTPGANTVRAGCMST